MNSIVVPDMEEFKVFEAGKVIEAHVIIPADQESEFAIGNFVEVWYKANSGNNPHYTGKVIKNLGYVYSIPPAKPQVLKVRVGIASAEDILGIRE